MAARTHAAVDCSKGTERIFVPLRQKYISKTASSHFGGFSGSTTYGLIKPVAYRAVADWAANKARATAARPRERIARKPQSNPPRAERDTEAHTAAARVT